MKNIAMLLGMVLVLSAMGCCAPGGCGFGCRQLDGCYDCEGGFGPRAIPGGPIDAMRQARKSLVCGGGCGEVYWGEWRSTPPDCQDPCCDDQFVGGATPCRPFCWQPGTLLRGLYGTRFACESCGSVDDCGCDTGVVSGEYYEGAPTSHPTGCNCGGHASQSIMTHDNVVQTMPSKSSMQRMETVSARPLPANSANGRIATAPSRATATRVNNVPARTGR